MGIILNDQNNYSSHINEVVRTINYKLVNLILLKKYRVDFEAKKKFLNGFLVGKLNYGLPILINALKQDTEKLKICYYKIARSLFPITSRISNPKMFQKSGWPQFPKLRQLHEMGFIHNIITTKKPHKIYKNLVVPDRVSKEVRYNCSSKCKNIFYSLTMTYNKLPGRFRSLNKRGFKIKSKEFIPEIGI